MIQQGATWDSAHTAKFNHHDNNQCEHCGATDGDFAHATWTCPALCHIRGPMIADFSEHLDHTQLHPSLLYGIAPALTASHSLTYWGSKCTEGSEGTRKLYGITEN